MTRNTSSSRFSPVRFQRYEQKVCRIYPLVFTKTLYFEVVTICESIISDRIFSYVKGFNPASKANIKTPFERLISEWRTLAQGNLPQHGTSDLGQAVNSWRIERNDVVHGLAKSLPGEPTLPV